MASLRAPARGWLLQSRARPCGPGTSELLLPHFWGPVPLDGAPAFMPSMSTGSVSPKRPGGAQRSSAECSRTRAQRLSAELGRAQPNLAAHSRAERLPAEPRRAQKTHGRTQSSPVAHSRMQAGTTEPKGAQPNVAEHSRTQRSTGDRGRTQQPSAEHSRT